MFTLEATPERVAIARRMSGGGWSVPHGLAAFPGLPEAHVSLLDAGLAALVIGALGMEDYWALTEAGEQWLALAEAELERRG